MTVNSCSWVCEVLPAEINDDVKIVLKPRLTELRGLDYVISRRDN